MDILMMYVAIFLVMFLIMPCLYFTLRFTLIVIIFWCGCCKEDFLERQEAMRREMRRRSSLYSDRQGNIFTITDASGATRNFADFYVVEPSSDDTRVRAQMEKDDKDLPTYEEVMAATLAASAASYAAANYGNDLTSSQTLNNNLTTTTTRTNNNNTSSSTSIPMDVPPYSEVDPNPLTPVPQNPPATSIALPNIGSTTTSCLSLPSASSTNLSQPSTSTSISAPAAPPTTATTTTTTTTNIPNESSVV